MVPVPDNEQSGIQPGNPLHEIGRWIAAHADIP